MTENVVKSTDLDKKDAVKKTTTKKTPAKKAAQPKEKAVLISSDTKVIVFESGYSYTSGDFFFTRENPIQEVPVDVADRLLELDNFRLPDQIELEDYLLNKEV